jgi:nitrate/nitrite transporter NarK
MDTFPLWPIIGLTVGMALGFAGAFGGLGAFLLVLVLGAVGLLIGHLMEGGEVDLSQFAARRR